jgi:hypothetical protein
MFIVDTKLTIFFFNNLMKSPSFVLTNDVKRKAVLLHAMEVHGGRGGIAPTHT